MRNIKYIVLHCTSSPQTQTVEAIQGYWRSLGWKRNGYHHLIAANGNVHNLTPINEVSNGVKGFNANSIHIAYIGGCDKLGKTLDNRTDSQKQAQKRLVLLYKQQFPNAEILGHRDFSPDLNKNNRLDFFEWIKDCPAFDVKQWLLELKITNNKIAVVTTKTGGRVNLREKPSIASKIIDKLNNGVECTILTDGNDFAYVKIGTLKGYIKKDLLQLNS